MASLSMWGNGPLLSKRSTLAPSPNSNVPAFCHSWFGGSNPPVASGHASALIELPLRRSLTGRDSAEAHRISTSYRPADGTRIAYSAYAGNVGVVMTPI